MHVQPLGAVSSDHIKHPHHPLVFMLQDVAVVHAQPLHVLPDLESHCLCRSDVHCVLPGKIRGFGLGTVPLALGDLELCAVQMEWGRSGAGQPNQQTTLTE